MTLEVGTILVYHLPYNGGRRLVKIDRVTAKRAYAGTTEFKREYTDPKWLAQIGASKLGAGNYRIATESDIREITLETQHRAAVSEVERVAFKSLTTDQLNRILAIVGEGKEDGI